jgi:hypothetical protein
MSTVAIRWMSTTARELPLGSKLGFAVIVLGFAADVVAHFGPAVDHHHGGVTGPELSAHLVIFVGMVLVLVGVLIDGVRSGRRSARAAKGR